MIPTYTNVATLPIMEHFYTIQGEGFFTGVPAYFVRIGGCDVGCVWCDVKESWPADAHKQYSINEIIDIVGKADTDTVVITGGEPFMYNLEELTKELQTQNKRTHVETAGVYPVTGSWDWICFSPKKFKKPKEEYFQKADELKIVIYHPSDFEWAEKHALKVNTSSQLFLQPEWGKSAQILPLIISYVKKNPHWRISLQTHKYMDIP